MTIGFTSQLRTPDETIVAGGGADHGERITIRVQMPEVWDVVRIDAGTRTPMIEIKETALRKLFPEYSSPAEFMLKLNGFEVLDESLSIADEGARNGSTFLLTFRRRRPVR